MATVHGTNGADFIYNPWSLMGNDTIYGHDGDDTIFGVAGNDTIIGGAGADDIFGGPGNDTASYSDSTEFVVVRLDTGFGYNGTAEGDTLDSIENLTGSSYSDTLVGNDSANVLQGGYGNDQLLGLNGDDELYGGYHNDTLYGGAGADTLYGGGDSDYLRGGAGGDWLYGGDGIDTADYADSPAGVGVSLYTDSAAGGDAEGDELDSIENLVGSAYADSLWGNDGANLLDGLDGNDALKGFGGADLINGGDDNDTVWGMEGNDALTGGNGRDSLRGGAGLDIMWGGSGADTFVWETTEETGVTAATADGIMDFSPVQGDRIGLSLVDANVYAVGNQAFTFIGTAAFSGAPGEIRYYQADGDTYIEMQTGTSVDVEGVIRLDGLYDPDASWFLV
jgi:Ca2+-binding RTX toxin-like protein